jgi:hypothetical protein
MIPRRRFTNLVSKRKKGEHRASDDQGSVQMICRQICFERKYYILICTVDMLVEKYLQKSEKKRNGIELRCVTDLDHTGGAPMSPGQNCAAGGSVLRRKETRRIGLG